MADDGQESPLPQPTLPKGGGSIRGIGEKFGANPMTGTASFTVPLAISAPLLSLSYYAGAGNGVFGWGFNVGLPSITRKTDKGLPLYGDAEDSDAFILSGAEDLVPQLTPDDPLRPLDGRSYVIRRSAAATRSAVASFPIRGGKGGRSAASE